MKSYKQKKVITIFYKNGEQKVFPIRVGKKEISKYKKIIDYWIYGKPKKREFIYLPDKKIWVKNLFF